jgi:L-lactate dehydrogenase complex protein LldG
MTTNSLTRPALLKKIREGLEPLGDKRTAYPEWDASILRPPAAAATVQAPSPSQNGSPDKNPRDLWQTFCANLEAVHGRGFTKPAELADYLRSENALHGYCDPTLLHHFSQTPHFEGFTFETHLNREVIDTYAFGITRASAGIAESGTLVLKDAVTTSRLAALAPWIHIAFLDPKDILPDITAALAELGDDPSIIWATGPSKTADIEGILIEGVHGPGIQIAYAPAQDA